MKRIGLAMVAALATAVLVGSPALAAHKRMARSTVSCKEIKDAIAAGKSEEDVQKEKNVSAARVKSCTTPAPAKKHRAAKKT
ncbi:MAG: hypothetical protein E6J79_02575 [Deltaproteobacteria bacterium]|nr:MAG: hypothetical protein E6J79_02575 [Deltaproteobacteria bacterium]